MNRLADETSPFLLQHAEATLAAPIRGGRGGFAGATVFVGAAVNRLADETSPFLLQHAEATLAAPIRGGRGGFAGATVFVGVLP